MLVLKMGFKNDKMVLDLCDVWQEQVAGSYEEGNKIFSCVMCRKEEETYYLGVIK
jgi:hypothetical protein